MRVYFAALAAEQSENELGVTVPAAPMKGIGECQLHRGLIGRADLVGQAAIFIGGLGITVLRH